MTLNDPRIAAYLRRLGWALSPLPSDDREAILAETEAHLLERLAQGDVALTAALQAFGPADEYARAFIEEYRLVGAISAPTPMPMLREALSLAGRSVVGFLGALFFLMLYLLELTLLLVAVVKPILPQQTGLFVGPDTFALAVLDEASAAAAAELLGYWLIPLALIGALLVHVTASHFLRRFLRMFLRRRLSSPIDRE